MEFLLNYNLLKTVHILAVVSWFAGLFYLPRLLVYFVEAQKQTESECKILQTQYLIMMRRLWFGIMMPAMVVTLLAGLGLILTVPVMQFPWMHAKLLFVFLLVGYHHYLGALRKKAMQGVSLPSSFQLRLINELAVLFLMIIVSLVVFKTSFHWGWGLASWLMMAGLIVWVIRRRRA